MPKLSRQEKNAVSAGRQSPRPEFFRSDTQQNTPISADFEAFLILQGSDQNQNAVDWLTRTVDFAEERKGRDGILKESLDFDRQDNEDVRLEISETLSEFNNFREQYQVGRFASTPETGMLLADLQRPASELFFEQDRSIHLRNMHNFVDERLRNQGVTEDEARQIQSWITPLLSY